jgi:hypothetical protein
MALQQIVTTSRRILVLLSHTLCSLVEEGILDQRTGVVNAVRQLTKLVLASCPRGTEQDKIPLCQ